MKEITELWPPNLQENLELVSDTRGHWLEMPAYSSSCQLSKHLKSIISIVWLSDAIFSSKLLQHLKKKKSLYWTEKFEVLCLNYCLISHRSLGWKEALGIRWSYPIPGSEQGTILKLHQISKSDNIVQDHIKPTVNISMDKDYINSLSNSFKYLIILMLKLLFFNIWLEFA